MYMYMKIVHTYMYVLVANVSLFIGLLGQGLFAYNTCQSVVNNGDTAIVIQLVALSKSRVT